MNFSIEEREAKLRELRETLDASIARGGAHSDEDVGARVEVALDAWKTEGDSQIA